MADVKLEDFSIKVKNVLDDKINAVLEECAGELESATKRNYDSFPRVDTGKTKNSFRHHVNTATHEASIGSNDINAIYEEFGTGEYALHGNGRKGGWVYVDAKGKGHFTYGKRAGRHLHKAFTSLKTKIINHIQDSLKGL